MSAVHLKIVETIIINFVELYDIIEVYDAGERHAWTILSLDSTSVRTSHLEEDNH